MALERFQPFTLYAVRGFHEYALNPASEAGICFRIVVASPGYPPSPLTLAKLRRGHYRACSRNPVIAQTLATLHLMEQRGSGFARMRDARPRVKP